MKCIYVCILAFCLLSATSQQGRGDEALRTRVTDGLVENGGWNPVYAELIAEKLEASFGFHDTVGTLDDRIRDIRRLNSKTGAQLLAVQHPGYLDAFLLFPDDYVAALRALGSDQVGEEQVLAALLRRPTGEGLKDSVFLLRRYGLDLARLAPEPGFLDLFEALSWVADDPVPPELLDWLGLRLHEMRREDMEAMTELFLTHRRPLRDGKYSRSLEMSWKTLRHIRRSNPSLADLLLEHLDVWSVLNVPGFVAAMDAQMQKNEVQAQQVLVFLLGWQGSRYAMSGDMPWTDPLPDENRTTALDILEVNDSAIVSAMFQWRDDPRFWVFAADLQKRKFIPCLVMKEGNDLAKLGEYLDLEAQALSQVCRPGPSIWVRIIPGSGAYLAAVKMWSGAPLQTSDYIDAGFDTVSLVMIAVPGSGQAAKGLGLVGRLMAPGRGVVASGVEGMARAAAVTSIRSGLLAVAERESANITRGILNKGIGRAFGVSAKSVLEAARRNSQTAQAIQYAFEEKIDEVSMVELFEYAVSTEFFRCFGLPEQLRQNDLICQSLLPAIVVATEESIP